MLYYIVVCRFFFFKQKTAYEMRISDWSSDVCSSDLTVEIDKHAFLGAVAILQHCVEAGCAYVDKIFVHQLHDLEETLGIPPLLIHEFVDLIQIGRASCRERVLQYGSIAVVDVSLKKKKKQYS